MMTSLMNTSFVLKDLVFQALKFNIYKHHLLNKIEIMFMVRILYIIFINSIYF